MRLLLVAVLAFLCIQCKESIPPFGVKNVDVATARQLINDNKKMVILDVRTPEEAAEGKLDRAIVIDVTDETFKEEVMKLDTNMTYLVYCRSGRRSQRAVEVMSEVGFNRIYQMEGGYLSWEEQPE